MHLCNAWCIHGTGVLCIAVVAVVVVSELETPPPLDVVSSWCVISTGAARSCHAICQMECTELCCFVYVAHGLSSDMQGRSPHPISHSVYLCMHLCFYTAHGNGSLYSVSTV